MGWKLLYDDDDDGYNIKLLCYRILLEIYNIFNVLSQKLLQVCVQTHTQTHT